MEAVSLAIYDKYLTGLNFKDAIAMKKKGIGMSNKAMMARLKTKKTESKSAIGKMTNTEQYNLAVGIYNGHVEANQRVKPIPRNVAPVDLTAMIKQAGVSTAADVSDYFERRFLSVPLQKNRKAAIVKLATQTLGTGDIDLTAAGVEQSLREILHVILSAPEYQLG